MIQVLNCGGDQMTDHTLGANIRKYREARGMKQETLAELTDLSITYMSNLERNNNFPSMEAFISIADVLEVSADALLFGVLKVGNQIRASELWARIEQFPPAEQKKILNVVDTMFSDCSM